MSEPRSPVVRSAFRDRSTRLVLFGALSVAIGGICGLFGLLYVVLALTSGRLLGAETLPVDARSYVMGAMIYFLLGGAFVWVGIGSMRKRRWVRPLMLTLAWTWMLSGASALVLMPGLLDGTLVTSMPGSALDETLVRVIKLGLLGAGALFGVVLPALYVLVYQDRQLRMTCEVYDPECAWTERCPSAVLGLSVGLGACGVIAVPMALRPVVPLFGWLVTGPYGAGLLLIGAGMCFWMARKIYEQLLSAWWVTTLFLTLAGVSTWATLARVEPAAWYQAMGYPEELLESMTLRSTIPSWLTVAVTLLTLVYMVGIRKHFRASQDNRGGTNYDYHGDADS